MHSRRTKRTAAALVALLCIAAAVYVFRAPLLRFGIVEGVALSTHTHIAFSSMQVHGNDAALSNVVVRSSSGELIASVPSVRVAYDLRDLLPGGKRLYGLKRIDLDRPQIVIVRHRDGTYNVPLLKRPQGVARQSAPMRFTVHVTGGTLTVTDLTRIDPSSQHLYLDDVNLNANVDTAARTTYNAAVAYREGSRRYPIRGTGLIDQRARIVDNHWTAARVPLPRLVNYAVNNAAIRMTGGALEGLDARYYGLADAQGAVHPRIAASAVMSGGKIAVRGVSQPVRNVHGALDVTNEGLTTQGISASIGSMPVRVTGGILDLGNPRFRLAIDGRGDVAQLKGLAAATARLPLRGAIDFGLLVEGSVHQPLTLIAMRSPQIGYRGVPIDAADALVAFDGHEADVLGLQARYGQVALAGRGRLDLKAQQNAAQMLVRVNGPSSGIPYADTIASGTTVHGAVLATGNDLKHLDTQGLLAAAGPNRDLLAMFHVNAKGSGTIGPIAIHQPGGSLFANVNVDRPHGQIAAVVDARHFRFSSQTAPALPGLHVKPLPPVAATLNGTLYETQQGKRMGLLGAVRLQDARYGAMQIADARARFAGNMNDVRIAALTARGSFGTLDASGTLAGTNHVALQGRYRGSLSALAKIAGNLPATGTVDAPVALVYDAGRTVAQIRDARFSHASVRGVPIDALSATVAARGKNVAVYAARATVAHGAHALASGSLGNGHRIALSVADYPIASGRASAGATVDGSMQAPDVRGALLLQGARYQRYPIDAASAFAYSGDAIHLHDATIGVGPAFVALDGTISGIRMGAPIVPAYDLDASMRGADAGALVALAAPKLRNQYVAGSVDANVHVGGAGRTPAIAGTVSVPAGSVHGLAFRDMRANLNGTASNLSVDAGHVTVGSTALAFGARIAPGVLSGSMSAPRADLADFNDYFDTGDTLAGTGRLSLALNDVHGRIASNGSVRLADVRYKRFDVGNTTAVWTTNHAGTIDAVADVVGAAGTAHIAGGVTGKRVDLRATARRVDLAAWLPMAGYHVPVSGFVNADASVVGTYPDVSMAANASVDRGLVKNVPIQRAQMSVAMTRGRGRITNAIVQIPNLVATGAGTFGLHARDRLALAVHGTSPNIGALFETVSGKPHPELAGALDTTVHVTGTRLDPHVSDDLTLSALRYKRFTVPRVAASVAVSRRNLTLRRGEIDLQHGRVLASAVIPVHLKPTIGVGPSGAPVALRITANGVDASDAAGALPAGTTVRGLLDGTLAVSGTVDAPRLNGGFALRNGYFVGPIDQNPISDLNGQLAFAGNGVTLSGVHANVGGGTMTMQGTAVVPNVRDIRDATFNAQLHARGAQFNSPQYFRGKANADITASRATGGLPTIAGNVDIPSGRIPLTAFWNPKAPKTPKRAPPDIALNVHATVGNDVRVQSPNVDVGAQGSVTVGGTLPKPTLSGEFASTGGTVDFLRRFNVESANVTFSPADGIMPYVDAYATTFVQNPQTYVSLHVIGYAPDHMNLALDSDPSYDRSQILALLVGGSSAGNFSAGNEIQQLAAGQLNTFFTRNLLEPLDVAFGNSLGLQNLQLTDDFTSGLGISAAKAFGKHLTAVYDENLGQPRSQSLSIEAHKGTSTAFKLMLYNVQDAGLLGMTPSTNLFGFDDLGNSAIMNGITGTNGFSLTYEHKFD